MSSTFPETVTKNCIAPLNRLYKLLDPNGVPCNGGRGQWPLPNEKPGAWLQVTGAIIPCENGLHLCRVQDLVHHWIGPELYLAQPQAHTRRVVSDDKVVVRKARLLRRIETWNDQTLRLLAADCAERAMRHTHLSDSRAWATVRAARQYAFGLIEATAWDAAWDTAWAAARDVARAAAWAAVWDVAWDAARAAARAAVQAAARNAAKAAERRWQTKRLFAYLNKRVDLDTIRQRVLQHPDV